MGMGGMTILAIVLLLAIFIVGTIMNANLGILGFVASLFLGYFLNAVPIDDILGGINTELFVILVGVTYFFNLLRGNGTIDLVVSGSLRLVRGRVALIPWVMYFLSYILAALGTQGTAVIVIVAPIALTLANECKFSQLMTSVMVAFGMFGGLYSPLNVNGIGAENLVLGYGVDFSFLTTNALMLLFTTCLALIFFVAFGGVQLFKRGRIDLSSVESGSASLGILQRKTPVTPYRVASLLGLAVLVFLGMYLKLNMGFSAMLVGCILGLGEPSKQKEYVSNIPWATVLMVTGIICYIETMSTVGVMDYLENVIQSFNNPKLTLLIASYIGGFISAFCSTLGTLTGIIPMVGSTLGDPTVSTPAAVACLCIASTIVDICPFSPTGALFVANSQGEEKNGFYKRLLIVAGIMVVVGPLVTWAILVLPF